MKTLIVDDDSTCCLFLQEILKSHGVADIAPNGKEAIEAVRRGLNSDQPYDLICLDIMLPEVDGHTVLKNIRSMEQEKGIDSARRVKIVMTTALHQSEKVDAVYGNLRDAYLVKPIAMDTLNATLRQLGLIH